MVKRAMFIGLGAVGTLAAFIALAGWMALASWLPTKGKARLIAAFERQTPIICRIDTLRYQLFRGFVVDGVEIADRASQEVWLSASHMDVQLGWLSLLFRRTVIFRAKASVEAPCSTTATIDGRYRSADGSVRLDVRTEDIPIKTVTAPLKPHLPRQLTDGSLRLMLHLTHQHHRTVVTIEDLAGTQLAWNDPPLALRGDVSLHGRLSPPNEPGAPWESELSLSLRRGEAGGLPTIQTISRLEGTARFSNDQLTIQRLSGTTLETSWQLEGAITTLTNPSMHALLSSTLEVSNITPLFPALKDAWPITGPADVKASCHGPLKSLDQVDCIIHAELKGATLASPWLSSPLTQITGSLEYDLMTRRLTIGRIEGALASQRLSAKGDVAFHTPVTVSLDLGGTVPFEPLNAWLSATTPLSQIEGNAALALHLEGPATAPQPTGRIDLRDVGLRFDDSPHTITQLSGAVLVNDLQINVEDASLQLDGHPLTVTATIMPGRVPRTLATIGFSQGTLQLAARLTPQDILIDTGELALTQTRLQFNGAVSRTPAHPIQLNAKGVVELAELKTLPLWPSDPFAGWNPEGRIDLTIQASGALQDWRAMTIRSRISAEQLRLRDVPIAQLSGTFEQSDHIVRAKIPAALIGDGKFWGELTIDRRPRMTNFLLQADIVGLQLARLSEAIPSWRSRSVVGNASAHTLMSGAWEDRPSWRAEGWCNVTGARLANVPLLDKLFRGLFGVLADRLGLEMLRRAEITQVSGRWQLAQERVGTDDLRLGGLAGEEPVAIYAKGSIGLDRTLDFVVEPELSEGALLQSQVTSTLAGTVLKTAGQLDRLRRLIGRHRLTGTVDKPVYRFEFTPQELLKQLLPGPIDLFQQLFDTVQPQ